mgnify:CR=1 FL=1
MNRIFVDKLNRDFKLELCKVNKEVVCSIPKSCLNSLTRSLTEIDTMELVIDKHYIDKNGKIQLSPVWEQVKEERLICLNNSEYFVIKVNSYKSSEDQLNITAQSLEYKLSKIDISVEDVAFYLMDKDEENYIYSLNDYMYAETRWKFGHIDDSVRYDIGENGRTDKLRMFSSISSRWYDFLTEDIYEAFNCLVVFDTYNKIVLLYDANSVGENVQIYLSHDNYIRSLERTSSTEDLVTRMYLVGNEEMDIISSVVTGYPYIENYSYFIDNNEMSNELTYALKKYNDMVATRQPIWEGLVKTKSTKLESSIVKKNELYVIYEEIRALKSIKESYVLNNDTKNEVLVMAQITEKIDKQILLEIEIKKLEDEIAQLQDSINNINELCKREYATDEKGNLIFNTKTLDELKEFIYCETYSNDSFLDVKDLIQAGERELSLSCYPSINYTLDIKNFMSRIIKEKFRLQWQGDIGLGDIVILYDKDLDEEVFLFLTDYTQRPNEEDESGLDITLSNKKYQDKNIRTIADKLKEGSLAMRNFKKKSYVFNNVKYNRININKDQIGGNI